MSQYEWPSFTASGGVISQSAEQEEIQPPTAEELESMMEEMRRQGFEEGLAQGQAAAAQEQAQWLEARQADFDQQIAAAQQQLTEALNYEQAELVRAIEWMCRETCQQALLNALDQPDTLEHLIEKLLTQLPEGAEHQIFLHPDQAHRIAGAQADAGLSNWGIRIETADLTLAHDPIQALDEQE